MDNVYWIAGFLSSFLVVLIIAMLLKLFYNKKRKKHNERIKYDERQLAARGDAYKTAFFTGMVYFVAVALVDVLEVKWAELSVVMFIGLFLITCVFATVALFKDAYFIDSRKSTFYPLIIFLCGALNGVIEVSNLIDGEEVITNGVLNLNSINGIVCVFFVILSILMFAKKTVDRKAVEKNEKS